MSLVNGWVQTFVLQEGELLLKREVDQQQEMKEMTGIDPNNSLRELKLKQLSEAQNNLNCIGE